MLFVILCIAFVILCGVVIWMRLRPSNSSTSVNFTCPTPSTTITEYKRDSVFPCNTHVQFTSTIPFTSFTYYDTSGSIYTTNDANNFIIPVGPTVTAIYFIAKNNSNVYHCWLCNINCTLELLCMYNNKLTPFPFTIRSTTVSPLFSNTSRTAISSMSYPPNVLGQNILSNMGTFPNFMYIQNFTTNTLTCTVYVNLINAIDDIPEPFISLTQGNTSDKGFMNGTTNRISVATTQSTGNIIILATDTTTYFGTILYKLKDSQKLLLLPFGFVTQTPLLGLSMP